MLAVIDFATTSTDHANPLDVLQKLREQAGGIRS